jgi:hypothetical protein
LSQYVSLRFLGKNLGRWLASRPRDAKSPLEAAEKEHGDGEAAHRIALASLKHSFEKVGDHWE